MGVSVEGIIIGFAQNFIILFVIIIIDTMVTPFCMFHVWKGVNFVK